MATLTASGRLTAYEFKVGDNLKAIEQAVKNAHAFQRSYVVTATRPSLRNLQTAANHGVGVILMINGEVKLISTATLQQSSHVSRRLRDAIQKRARSIHV